MDDLPVALGDALRVKGCACNDLPGDREGRDADAVWLQIGPENRRRRPEGRFAEGDGRQGWHGITSETAAGVDVGSGVSQGGGELVEAVGAASNQGDSVPIVGETTSHGFAEAGPGADQQQVAAVD